MKQTFSYLTMTAIQVGTYIGVSSIMVGHMLYTAFGLCSAITSVVFGSVLLWLLGYIFTRLALVRRDVLAVIVAEYLGKYGAFICGITFTISLIGWFAVQLNVISECVRGIYPFLPEILFKLSLGSIITLNVANGMKWIAKVADLVVPFVIFIMIISIWLLYDPGCTVITSPCSIRGVPLFIAFSIAGVIDIPTYFCNSRSLQDASIANALVYLIILPFAATVGILIGLYTNSTTLISALLSFDNRVWRFLILLFITLAGWTTNNGNLYSASQVLSLSSSLSFKRRTWLAGAAGSILSCTGVMSNLICSLEVINISVSALGAVICGRFVSDKFYYSPPSQAEYNYYLFFLGSGVFIGLFSHFEWISLCHSPLLDSFLTSLIMVFIYESIKRWVY